MRIKETTIVAVITLLSLSIPNLALAQIDEKANSIAARSDSSDDGFESFQAQLTMTLRNAEGQETIREMEIRTLERENTSVGDRSILRITAPRDVNGTAFLSHSKLVEPDDQWIFLPALRRVKRIASVNKSGPFLGSEFAFEDFTSQELGKYSYRYLDEQKCGEFICDVIERTPLYEYSGYSKQVAWIDQTEFQFRKIELYDRAGSHIKTLTLEDYVLYLDKFWRAQTIEMVNLRNGKSTTLKFGQFSFDVPLNEQDFTAGALQRLR